MLANFTRIRKDKSRAQLQIALLLAWRWQNRNIAGFGLAKLSVSAWQNRGGSKGKKTIFRQIL